MSNDSNQSNAAFISGSHIYGVPDQDSDVDLVLFIAEPLAMWLYEMLHDGSANSHTPAFGSIAIRHGKINLICCWNQWVYELWLRGTLELAARKPVTRDQAIALFDTLRFGAPQDRPAAPPAIEPNYDIPY